MKVYSMLGLPGCLATFIPWGCIPKHLLNLCKGDKGVGLLFEVIVTHTIEVISVEGGYYATVNDKNSSKYSQFLSDLKKRLIGEHVSFRLKTGMGDEDFIEISSCYVIADNGYLEWPTIICGFGVTSDPIEYKFNDWIASIRKDVECFFAILKQRFRYFVVPCTLHNKIDIDNAFRVACMLHNLILRHDGLDKLWESNINWDKVDPNGDGDEDDIDDFDYNPTFHDEGDIMPPEVAATIAPGDITDFDQVQQVFKHFQKLISRHLHFAYRSGILRWPKTRKHIIERDFYNGLPRLNFPLAGDIPEVEFE
jgi:hypothetical protein